MGGYSQEDKTKYFYLFRIYCKAKCQQEQNGDFNSKIKLYTLIYIDLIGNNC